MGEQNEAEEASQEITCKQVFANFYISSFGTVVQIVLYQKPLSTTLHITHIKV